MLYDVAVIGGGPAGSSAASYLSKEGLKVVLFEKKKFPRPHVGESLVPSVNRVLNELGLFEQLEEHGFLRKYGAAWTTVNTQQNVNHNFDGMELLEQVDILFKERKQPDRYRDYTFHVDRAKFDEILLKNSERLGTTVYQNTGVQNTDFSNPDYVELDVKTDDEVSKVKAKMVVDASGRDTNLGTRLQLKISDASFNQFAIHSWYKNFDRKENELKDYIFIHHLPFHHTWIWQIPITNEITSLGLVTSKEHIKGRAMDLEGIFKDFLANKFELAERINKAERIRPFTLEADYSYSMKQMAGDRFILVGDAARYVDPIFSSGVSIALNGARYATDNIIKAFSKPELNLKREAFKEYEKIMNAGCRNWYKFITMYYRLHLLFTWFVKNPKYRLEVIRFLQGDVYDEEESFLLKEMEETIREVEKNPKHVWHNLLNDIQHTEVKH